MFFTNEKTSAVLSVQLYIVVLCMLSDVIYFLKKTAHNTCHELKCKTFPIFLTIIYTNLAWLLNIERKQIAKSHRRMFMQTLEYVSRMCMAWRNGTFYRYTEIFKIVFTLNDNLFFAPGAYKNNIIISTNECLVQQAPQKAINSYLAIY